MARRREEESLVNVLKAAPWQVSAALACVAFAAFRWVIPAILAGNVFRPILMPFLGLAAWVAPIFFGLIALIALVNAQEKPADRRPGSDTRKPHPARPRQPQASATAPATIKADAAPTIADAAPAPPDAVPASWTLAALRSLEWKRFELLCAKYYETVAFKAETLPCGPDGGIDVKLYKQDDSKPIAIVQCKAWNSSDVGVKELRELLGVMTHEKVKRGIFITTAAYTKDAAAFGAGNPIQMLDGAAFLAKIAELSEEQQKALREFAFDGDYQTPTCPSCGIKMKRREGKKGAFFGCGNYPRCRRTFGV